MESHPRFILLVVVAGFRIRDSVAGATKCYQAATMCYQVLPGATRLLPEADLYLSGSATLSAIHSHPQPLYTILVCVGVRRLLPERGHRSALLRGLQSQHATAAG